MRAAGAPEAAGQCGGDGVFQALGFATRAAAAEAFAGDAGADDVSGTGQVRRAFGPPCIDRGRCASIGRARVERMTGIANRSPGVSRVNHGRLEHRRAARDQAQGCSNKPPPHRGQSSAICHETQNQKKPLVFSGRAASSL